MYMLLLNNILALSLFTAEEVSPSWKLEHHDPDLSPLR